MNEDISLQFFAGQHRENYRFPSRLDAVKVRAVTCELHGHARLGWAWGTSLGKKTVFRGPTSRLFPVFGRVSGAREYPDGRTQK